MILHFLKNTPQLHLNSKLTRDIRYTSLDLSQQEIHLAYVVGHGPHRVFAGDFAAFDFVCDGEDYLVEDCGGTGEAPGTETFLEKEDFGTAASEDAVFEVFAIVG
jgi:hypothetical protein